MTSLSTYLPSLSACGTNSKYTPGNDNQLPDGLFSRSFVLRSLQWAALTLIMPLVLALFLVGAFGDFAHAQRVSPMSYQLAPSGAETSTVMRVENTSQSAMTIELTASRVSVDEVGKETRTPSEDDFLIFPPQAIIKPGKTQSIRIKYVGDPNIDEAAVYRISVSQLPVDLGGPGSAAVGFIINFHTLAIVAPDGAEPELTVGDIKRGADGNWELAISNSGKSPGRLSRTDWLMTDASGAKKRFSKQDVSQMTDKNLVMPGSTLKLSIPAVDGFSPETSKVAISTR